MAFLPLYLPFMAMLLLLPYTTADCTKFTASRDYYSTIDGRSQRVSPGYTCAVANSNYIDGPTNQQRCNSTECPTKAWGTVNGMGRNNLSLTHDQVLPLYSLIPTQTTYKPQTFLYSLSSAVTNISSCLGVQGNATTAPAGWWNFTPYLMCIDGVLEGCSNGPVDSGTAIQLCAIQTFGDYQYPQVYGVVNFVTSDPETASTLTTNPATSVSALAREPAATGTGANGTSAGNTGALSGGRWTVVIVMVGLVVVATI